MEENSRENLPATADTKRQRRTFSLAAKRQMVEETLTGEVSVSQVARMHDVNANQLFKWRKLYRDGLLGKASTAGTSTGLLPVVMSGTPSDHGGGTLHIDLGNGRRVTVEGSVDAALLRATLEALR